ncbi:MAG: hypothetical protein ABSF92_05445 [Candidatus Acidiferrales bacterium]
MTSSRFSRGVMLAAVALLVGWPAASRAQDDYVDEILATRRVFESVGPGLRAIRRDAAGHYYLLTAPGTAVLVFDAQGKGLRQVPPAPNPPGPAAEAASTTTPSPNAIVFGEGLDVDTDGRVYVADRGANLVRVFNPDGTPSLTIPIVGPNSVAAIGEGEIAVATAKSPRLVTVFDRRGKVVREFGDPAEMAERPDLNRFLNIGHLDTDAHGHLYYSFAFLPEPTVRKYDRLGYASLVIEANTIDSEPEAQAVRREIARQEHGGAPVFKPVVTALGVDPQTEDVWISIGGRLLHFDREGVRRAEYRIFTPTGGRLEATTILVEPGRLLVGGDPLGVYEFARPDKKTQQ